MKTLSFGETIRTHRKQAKLTTEDLAKKIRINRSYISKIERYNVIPAVDIVARIAEELGQSPLVYVKLAYEVKEKQQEEKMIEALNKMKFKLRELESLMKKGIPQKEAELKDVGQIFLNFIFKTRYVINKGILEAISEDEREIYKKWLKDFDNIISETHKKVFRVTERALTEINTYFPERSPDPSMK